jgi:hypothetical protein
MWPKANTLGIPREGDVAVTVPVLTPWQELNARTIGRFLGLAHEAKHGLDHQYLVDQLVGIAEEYQRQDEALLNALPRSGK